MGEGSRQELQDLADAELEEAFIYLTRYISGTCQSGDESNTRIEALRDAIAREYARRHHTPIESAPDVIRKLR
jgi:uncharacterized protein (DUF924 family)